MYVFSISGYFQTANRSHDNAKTLKLKGNAVFFREKLSKLIY